MTGNAAPLRPAAHRVRTPEDLAAEAKLLEWGVSQKKLTRRAIDEVRALLEAKGKT